MSPQWFTRQRKTATSHRIIPDPSRHQIRGLTRWPHFERLVDILQAGLVEALSIHLLEMDYLRRHFILIMVAVFSEKVHRPSSSQKQHHGSKSLFLRQFRRFLNKRRTRKVKIPPASTQSRFAVIRKSAFFLLLRNSNYRNRASISRVRGVES